MYTLGEIKLKKSTNYLLNFFYQFFVTVWLLLSLFRSRNILDDFREAYFWLRQNTDDNARCVIRFNIDVTLSGNFTLCKWKFDKANQKLVSKEDLDWGVWQCIKQERIEVTKAVLLEKLQEALQRLQTMKSGGPSS